MNTRLKQLYGYCMGKSLWGLPLLGVASVIGGFLLQFTMGTFYSFGNIMTYLVSYMRASGAPSAANLTQAEFVIVQSTWGMTQGVVMPLSGFLIELIGPKASMTLGATIFRYTTVCFWASDSEPTLHDTVMIRSRYSLGMSGL